MRFRLIEKDTVGTGTEFVQADKKTIANSKTYIPKPRSKKVDMNKVLNSEFDFFLNIKHMFYQAVLAH